MKILLVIPAYNEEANIVQTIREVEQYQQSMALGPEHQLDYLVINDGSTDSTKEKLIDQQIPAVHLVMNLGIGGAVQTGYKYAKANNYDVAVQFDGDGQHDIGSLRQVLADIEQNTADFVIGSRFIPGQKASFQTTPLRRLGIKILSLLIQLATGRKIYDVTSGYRAANKQVIAYFAQNYPISYPEPESTVHLLKRKFRITEVPVTMHERQGGRSSIRHLTSIKYMLEVSLAILVASFLREKKE